MPGDKQHLVVRARSQACALPVSVVVETMRPLPISALAGMPSFVRGVAVIRGSPTPVIDLGSLAFGSEPGGSADGRFVTLRLGTSQVALSVDAVLGVRTLDAAMLRERPTLLRTTAKELIAEIGPLDEELLVVLRDAWVVPEDIYRAMREAAT